MSGVPAVTVLIPFEQRELVHPTVGQHVRVRQVQALAELVAKGGERLRDNRWLVGHDQHQVAHPRADARGEGGDLVFIEELRDRRAEAVLVDLDRGESLRASAPGKVSHLVDLSTRVAGAAWHDDRLDLPARFEHAGERLEPGGRKRGGDILEFQAEPQVWPVVAEAVHRLLVGQQRERGLKDPFVAEFGGQLDVELLRQGHNVLRIDE